MARLTDEEISKAISDLPKSIAEFDAEVLGDEVGYEERILRACFSGLSKAMMEDVKEIQQLRQQNADMAAYINAQEVV